MWFFVIVTLGGLLAVVFFGCLFFAGVLGVAATIPPTPQIVVNETTQVSDDTIRSFTFTLTRSVDLNFEMDVVSGGQVRAYVLDQAEYAHYVSVNSSLFGGSFRHYEALGTAGTRQHRAHGRLNAGTYVVVMQEASSPNIFSGPDVALVRTQVTVQ